MAPIGIKILLPSGDPNGIKVIEITGWRGQAYVIPRGKLKEMKDKEEAKHPAIYFLFGEGEEPTRSRVYIGESESFYNRLVNHDDNKDFWNNAVVFTGGVNRAHVKFLENASVRLAKEINRYEIVNQVEPLQNRLTDFEKAEANDFFEKTQLILGVVGFALFQDIPKQQTVSELYYLQSKGAEGKGTLLDTGEFIVFEGSTARLNEVKSLSKHAVALRRKLESEGILQNKGGDLFHFTKDYIFTSPSAASDTVTGYSVNGWTAWKDSKGKTLDENKRK